MQIQGRENTMDEIKMAEKLEALLKDYDYTPQYQVEVMGRKIDVPVKYSDASAFTVFFPISFEKAQRWFKSIRLTPVSILRGKCVLAITFFDYRKCPVDPYHEFTFSIPVLIDSKFTVPILPIIFDSVFQNFGYHVILMGADTYISRKHIEQIFPYPTVKKELFIDLREDGKNVLASINEGGEKIISVRQSLPLKYKLEKKGYNTYYEKDGQLYNVRLDTFSYSARIFRPKELHVDFGRHKISGIFTDLDMGPVPLLCTYYKKAVEIASGPKKL